MTPLLRPALLLSLLILGACATQPERPETLRQALLNLGERAAARVIDSQALPHPPSGQVLLLAAPDVDDALSIGRERFLENLTRALLALPGGPQVLDWNAAMAEGGTGNQWRLDSRLEADGPRLQLSDRELLPYRLSLALRLPGSEESIWETEISGAIDTTAL